jgi:hypothetical protein
LIDLQTRLDNLQSHVADELRTLPGATELYLFGSQAEAKSDEYADIDLQVGVVDLAAARTIWPHFLERVGPIEIALPLQATPHNTAFAILFHGASYYHKVDIGLSDASAPAPFASMGTFVQLWSQKPAASVITAQTTNAYIPAYDTTGYLLIDDLLSSVRYVKARKRGHHLTCWRFVRGKPDRLLHLMYEQLYGWQRQAQLTTWDYKKLDHVLQGETHERLLCRLDFSTPRKMDEHFYWFTERIVDLAWQKAQAQQEIIPADVVERLLVFLRAELRL